MRKTNGIQQFEKHCKQQYDAEMHYKNNKRQILAEKHEPRWAYSKNNGSEINPLVSDPNNLFMKSLIPLDKKAAQL